MECGAIDFKQFHHDPSLAHMILVRTQAAVQQWRFLQYEYYLHHLRRLHQAIANSRFSEA